MDFGITGNVPMIATSAPDIPAASVIASADQATWFPLENDHALIAGKMTITVGSQTLIAPGMYDLTGVPYALLRIPEIESNLYRSRAFQAWNYPMAKFKLSILGLQTLDLTFRLSRCVRSTRSGSCHA